MRAAKRDAWADNFETGQAVEVSGVNPSLKTKLDLRTDDGGITSFEGRVPERAGFFEVVENGKPILRGATHFADAREADFRDAGPVDTVDLRRWEAAMKQTEADPWMPLWMLLLLGCLVTAWMWRGGARQSMERGLPSAPTNPKFFPAG